MEIRIDGLTADEKTVLEYLSRCGRRVLKHIQTHAIGECPDPEHRVKLAVAGLMVNKLAVWSWNGPDFVMLTEFGRRFAKQARKEGKLVEAA